MQTPTPVPILLLITDLHLGGSPLIALSLATGLRDTGHWLPTVLSIAPLPRPPDDTIPQRLQSANIQVESLNISSPIQLPIALSRYIAAVKKHNPVLIHSILIHANTLATLAQPFLRRAAAGAANAGSIPLIHAIHTLQPNPRWHWSLQRLLLPHAAALIAPHPAILQKLAAPFPSSQTIPNGIDISRFKNANPFKADDLFPVPPAASLPHPPLPPPPSPPDPGELHAPNDAQNNEKPPRNAKKAPQNAPKSVQNHPQSPPSAFSIQHSAFSPLPPLPLIGYLGRFDPVKRLDRLLHAFATLVHTKSYGKILRLALVGYGPEEKNLKSLATSLHIAPQTLFPGPTAVPERWYKSFTLLCLPSTVEGFALTVIEALAAGIPIVAPHSPALDEIFPPDTINHSGASGTLTTSAQADVLASAMHEVITDPNANSAAAVSERLRLAERYSEAQMIAAYHTFFTKFLSPAT